MSSEAEGCATLVAIAVFGLLGVLLLGAAACAVRLGWEMGG